MGSFIFGIFIGHFVAGPCEGVAISVHGGIPRKYRVTPENGHRASGETSP